MSHLSITPNFPSFFGPIPRAPRGPGVPRPSPIKSINAAAGRLTVRLRAVLRSLQTELSHDPFAPPEESCRLVSLTGSGSIEVRLINELDQVPLWSLTAIAAHSVRFHAHRVTPRAEDVLFLHDLSERRGITHVPNTIRAWIDGGHFTGIYEGMTAMECVELIVHFKEELGSVPHHEQLQPYLRRAVREIVQTRFKHRET